MLIDLYQSNSCRIKNKVRNFHMEKNLTKLDSRPLLKLWYVLFSVFALLGFELQ